MPKARLKYDVVFGNQFKQKQISVAEVKMWTPTSSAEAATIPSCWTSVGSSMSSAPPCVSTASPSPHGFLWATHYSTRKLVLTTLLSLLQINQAPR